MPKDDDRPDGDPGPLPETVKVLYISFGGIVANELNPPTLPKNPNITIPVFRGPDDFFRAQSYEYGWYYDCELTFTPSYWQIILAVSPPATQAFNGQAANLQNSFPNRRQSPLLTFFGGVAEVRKADPRINQTAALLGLPALAPSFYEPMPGGPDYRSFRYAEQKNGTRVYIRTEL